jgi:Na+-transporting NADH:ubiquinone oxidoreductase subunit C
MFVVTGVFSSIVIGFAQLTRENVEANQALAFERAVISVLPGLYKPGLSRLDIHSRFTEKVTAPPEGAARPYRLQADGATLAYALPFAGQGFWAPIKGVIGIAADRKTVTGISFYEQNETPGLGARIVDADFTNQFVGRVLADGDNAIGLKPQGSVLQNSDVHAVTGATQTCTRLERIINDTIREWRSQEQ